MDNETVGAEFLKRLRDPVQALALGAKIIHQKEQKLVPYDPFAITHRLQPTVINYFSDPPKTEHNQTKWLVLLKYRQAGASLCAELAAYPKAAFNVGWDHVCIADKKDRSEYLHQRVQLCHANWPETIRAPSVPNREVRQLTFDQHVGGKMRVLTAGGDNEGIGQSFDSFHGSEVPFWRDAGEVMTLAIPAMINRDNVLVIMESTPAPLGAPSAEYFKDLYEDGKYHRGRWVSAFFPFWDGKLNARPWDNKSPLSNEEIRLLDKYGHLGLQKENLSFRRLMMETDPELKKNPELFQVWYPFDDITCWVSKSGAAIPYAVIERHVTPELEEWDDIEGIKIYKDPEPGAKYVLGADPAGYGARDHAAFQILEVWDDGWEQVVSFGKTVDPVEFAKMVIFFANKYNKALIVPEANGVGAALIAFLQEANYHNLYHREDGSPGAWAGAATNARNLEYLINALIYKDGLKLHDKDTVSQLISYKNDKMVERSVTTELLTGDATGKHRRSRHHWDKISALIYAVLGARATPQRKRPMQGPVDNVIPFGNMTYNQTEEYLKKVRASNLKDKSSTTSYRSRKNLFKK